MGQINCNNSHLDQDDPQTHSSLRYSIFEKMENNEKMQKSQGYSNEFKIGAYFQGGMQNQNDSKMQEKVRSWKNMARESSKKNNDQFRESLESQSGSIHYNLDSTEKMLMNCNQQKKSVFIKNVLKGPPAPLRWKSWKTMLKITQVFESGLYERQIENLKNNQAVYDQIQKDILRTFPSQYYFSNANKQLGHDQLLRILTAISNYFPHLGYCQGMNFVIGFLLLVSGGDEIDTFWAFLQLVKRSKFLMIGLFTEDMQMLKFMEFMTELFVKKELPKFYNKFKELEVPNSFWMTKWYMTLYLYNFPVNICLRIWDFFISEGIFGLITIIVPILRVFEKDFIEMEQLDVLEIFQNITRNEEKIENPKSEYYMDMSKIIEEAKKLQLSDSFIVNTAKTYEKQFGKGANPYVKLYLNYKNKEEFKKQVKEFIDQQINKSELKTEDNSQESQEDNKDRKQSQFSDQKLEETEAQI